MLKRCGAPAGLVALLLVIPAAAGAHAPGTYGGPADWLCRPALGHTISVGATRVSCRTARRVAARRVRDGARLRRWRCPGTRKGSAFGHCHGKGPRRGAIVHWGPNDSPGHAVEHAPAGELGDRPQPVVGGRVGEILRADAGRPGLHRLQ